MRGAGWLEGAAAVANTVRKSPAIQAKQKSRIASVLPAATLSVAPRPHVLRLAFDAESNNGAGAYNFISISPTGSPGTFKLSPASSSVKAGQSEKLALEWTVPSGGWRILYKVNQQKNVPILVMLGQHYRGISAGSTKRQRRPAARRPLLQTLGWDDLYQALVGQQQLSETQLRDMLRAIQREKQKKCC